MAYYNGTVANLSGLLTALTTACVTDGWTYAGGELSKHGCTFPISVDEYATGYNRLRMQIKSPTTLNLSPIAPIRETSFLTISYPSEYHLFTFDKEVYLVLNIQPGSYAWMAFGVSSISLPGSGAFLSATFSASTATASDPMYPGFAWRAAASSGVSCGTYIDHGLPYSLEFHPDDITYAMVLGAYEWYSGSYGIGKSQPNKFSGESILTPLRIFTEVSLNRYALVYESTFARHVRIDNYEDEQIITYGTDKWMIFPWVKRDSENRTTFNYLTTSLNTGTFGWAIRYEGP